jgi:LmbE family N-acetylglucosaminyl deacetylase
MHRILLFCVGLAGVCCHSSVLAVGERPEDRGAAAAWQAIGRLGTTVSVLDIIAHPDDEDGGTLTYLARGVGVRVMQLSLTRGEGGADLIAPFFFNELGVLRTLEFLEATRYYGTELYFTRAADYGFSKTVDEALKTWRGAETLLRDVVRLIRRERPTIIIARFRGDRHDGHGHHQLAGVIARQAYEAAADPGRFPDQIEEGLRPWRAKKLYGGNINPRWREEDKDAWTVVIDSGKYDPLLGRSYYQIARHGYGFHRSQGIMNHEAAAGPRKAYYRLVATSIPEYEPVKEDSMLDGLGEGFAGLRDLWIGPRPSWLDEWLTRIDRRVRVARDQFDALDPSASVDGLLAAQLLCEGVLLRLSLPSVAKSGAEVRFVLERKKRDFERAIVAALGLELEVSVGRSGLRSSSPYSRSTTFRRATPGQSFDVEVRLVSRSSIPVTPESVTLQTPDGWTTSSGDAALVAPLGEGDAFTKRFRVEVAKDAEPTRPYWHRSSLRESIYELREPRYLGLPFSPPPLSGRMVVSVADTEITLSSPALVTRRSLEFGTRHPPLVVAPAVSVRFEMAHGVLPFSREEYPLSVVVESCVDGACEGSLSLSVPQGWSVDPAESRFSFVREGEEATFAFVLRPGTVAAGKAFTIKAVAEHGGRRYSEGFVEIGARDVGTYDWYDSAEHVVRAVDVEIAESLRIGYVMGSGDEVPASLGFLGIVPTMLAARDLASGDLAGFDAIVVGVRAYAVRDDVRTHNARLLSYVEEGGVVIVQYQTPEFDENFGPFPYTMRRPEEVSEEDAKVTILAPKNPIFTTPNRITDADFSNWIEQRGSKFWRTWDARYEPLLECHDTGQEPQKGGMLYVRYGKGAYVYSAYAWYRQLPNGVPGAFRIYANMLSLARSLKER